ncbi:MAG: prepilin peptidase [bacterium]|nr:prepilin peptidase [bacterium]
MVVLLFIIGACLGSFYLVVGKRLPKNEDIIFSRSKCDNCNHTLFWYDLIPIFSYIFLRGKCKYCHKKISITNLLIEISMGLLFSIGYIYMGFSYRYFIYLILISLMILIFITDFLYYIILDSPLVISSILIIILKLIYNGYKDTILSILSGIVIFLVMYLIKIIGDKIFKRESLGGGDIKLSFVIGLTLGFRLSLISLILSSFLALPYSVASLKLQKNNEVPFGPFLVSSLFIVFLFYDKFINIINLF